MALARYSLNTLHAFAVAARQLNFTRAASELCVTQAAVSHQIKLLEQQIGRPLFLRTARGLQLSDEGERLAAPLQQAFAQIDNALQWLDDGAAAERLSIAVVGTFAQGWLLERVADFQARHPGIELRLQTHNNKIELASEAVDAAIRFGDGAWRSVQAEPLLAAPLSPLCSPALAQQLSSPSDLRRLPLLRSYRGEDWPAWARAAGLGQLVARGPHGADGAGGLARQWRGAGAAGDVPPRAGPGPAGAALRDRGRCRPLLADAHAVARAAAGPAGVPRLAQG